MKAVYLNLTTTDPAYNLAMEQYVFDSLPRNRMYIMLWQNESAVIVGRHQDTWMEVDRDYADRNGIKIVRRLSGGGAVYHDLGNLNFTFITDDRGGAESSFSAFCQPVIRSLAQLGVQVKMNGRNDITVQTKKFSGNAQYRREGRVMHHGTLLFDSDLAAAEAVLRPSKEKLSNNGVTSVRARITNLRPYLPRDMSLPEFRTHLLRTLVQETRAEPQPLFPQDLEAVECLRRKRYALPEWNNGLPSAHTLIRRRRVEGCGLVEAKIAVEGNRIRSIAFSGDFFSVEEPEVLAHKFIGTPLSREPCQKILSDMDVSRYFIGLKNETLLELLV